MLAKPDNMSREEWEVFLLNLSRRRRNKRRGAPGGAGAFVSTVYVEDHFNNATGANVALAGWMPDTIGTVVWNVNTASAANNAQVAFATDNVIATTTTASWYQNKAVLPSANYKVTALITDSTPGFSAPSLLLGFSDTILDGYRIDHENQNRLGMSVQRAIAGVFTYVGLSLLDSITWGLTPHSMSASRYVMTDRVRIKVQDNLRGYTAIVDDVDAARKVATLYPGLGLRNPAAIDDFKVESVPPQTRSGAELIPDGIWTWYNDPRAIVFGGRTYVGFISSAGNVGLAKLDNGVISSFTLKAALQIDDHDNPVLIVLPNGHLMALYSTHSGPDTFIRYRITTNPLPDISAWNSEAQINTVLGCAYPKPFILSDGKMYVFYREGNTSQRDTRMAVAPVADVEAGTPTWTLSTVLAAFDLRPYVMIRQNGPDRLDFSTTNGHPVEVSTSMYHLYAEIVAGTLTWFKSDGTSAGAIPIDPTVNATLVQNTVGGTNWNSDIAIGSDGHPRMSVIRFPTDPSTVPTTFLTDVEMWHYRWTGSAWTGFRFATGQHSLYPAQNCYVGNAVFDGNDATKMYSCEWDTTDVVYKSAAYSINEVAQTRTKLRDISADPSSHQWRPYSPEGHGSDLSVLCLEGGYNQYTGFQSTVRYYA